VTENLSGLSSATEIAETIRGKIRAQTGLTASAGVSYNKFLAKLASDFRKPDGLYVITPRMGRAFVESLAIEKFHGVGPATARKMKQLGVANGLDLREKPLPFLERHFGRSGAYFYWIARGVDERPVQADRPRKSIGAENTFATDIFSLEAARAELAPLVVKVWRHAQAMGAQGRSVTLKVKYADFKQITRSRTTTAAIATGPEFARLVMGLLDPVFPAEKGVRLLGVSLSSFCGREAEADDQLNLGF